MKKVKKLSLTDLVLYGLVFMVPIAPVSLYGVVYNLSHGMVALVYIIGAIAMFFTAYSYSTLSQHISSSGSAYAYAGVCPALTLTGYPARRYSALSTRRLSTPCAFLNAVNSAGNT